MIFSKKAKSAVGFLLSAGLLISCSENNSPQVKTKTGANGEKSATFYVDTLSAKFATVGEANAQGKQNKKLISFEACLKDNAQTNSVANVRFDIVAGEARAEKVSDLRGCLVWYEILEFDPDAEVKNIFMGRSLEAMESHSGAEKLVLMVNPHKDEFDFNRHGSVGDEPQARPVTYMLSRDMKTRAVPGYEYDIYVKISDSNSVLSPIGRQAEITSLRLDFRNIDYRSVEVDDKLNLTFPYTFKTSLAMDLIRQDIGNITSEKIKRGNFKFSLVFLKEAAKVDKPGINDIVAAVQWSARPRGDAGLIEVPVVVKFANVAALSSPMNVLLTITSLDQPALFADQSYDGIVKGITANKDLDIYLIPNENNGRELVEKYETAKAQKPVKNLTAKQVIESDGFKEISDTTVKFAAKKGVFSKPEETSVDLSKVIENLRDNQEVTSVEEQAICAAFFAGSTGADQAYKACLSNPKYVLSADVREFVVNITGQPTDVSFGRTETLNISAIFERSQSTSRVTGYGLDASVGAKANAGLGASQGFAIPGTPVKGEVGFGVNLDAGGKAYTGKSFEKGEKDFKGVSVSSSESVVVQPIAVTFNATTSKCLLVVANSKYRERMKSVKLPANKYFCLKSSNQGAHTEYFFLLDHKKVAGDTAVTDSNSSAVSPLKMLVRGQQPYDFLKGILSSDKYRYKIFVGMNSDKVTEDPANFMTQEAPMMLSSNRKVILSK
ncbi:MAG: hypothetical protein JNL11_14175 [Bdellovibrionaceae bacterium]|nr:hypothetical protein [Pseudobdellovibrionaceae bacterium]